MDKWPGGWAEEIFRAANFQKYYHKIPLGLTWPFWFTGPRALAKANKPFKNT